MANCLIAFPNWLDADRDFADVAFDGGGWVPELPLENLRDPYYAAVARSIDTTLNATQVLIDLGKLRGVRAGAIPFLSASLEAQLRLSGLEDFEVSATKICDSGWSKLYPIVFPSAAIVYEHSAAWSGRMSAEEAAVYPMPWFHLFDSDQVARYWLLEIDDRLSDRAYVEIPRLFLCPGISPEINFAYGASIGYEDPSQVEVSLGGAEFFELLDGRRVVRFTFDYQEEEFAVANWLDLQRRNGISGDVFFAWNPADTTLRHRRSFAGRLRQLSPLEAVAFGQTRATFELIERTA